MGWKVGPTHVGTGQEAEHRLHWSGGRPNGRPGKGPALSIPGPPPGTLNVLHLTTCTFVELTALRRPGVGREVMISMLHLTAVMTSDCNGQS